MSTLGYWVAALLVVVSCGLCVYAWITRDRDGAETDGAGFFYRHPSAEEYDTVLARRAQERADREQRADTVWATFAGPDAPPGLTLRRLPSRAEVERWREQWLGHVPSWQRETASTGVLPAPGGTRLVTRYAAAVERYRHGAGSLGELLAEMDLLAARHIGELAGPLALAAGPGTPAPAGGERMSPRPDVSWD
jgi:hypothetical protein